MARKQENKSVKKALLGSPLLLALMAASVVVFLLSFVGYVKRGGFWSPSVEARVYSQGRSNGAGGSGSQNERVFPFQGEVHSDAERIREAAALALGGMLCATQRTLEHRPVGTVEELLFGVRDDGALPPGMTIDPTGKTVRSEYGEYYVRYRSSPLGVEVVSLGKGAFRGAPFLVRLPDDGFNENALTYYVANKVDGVTAPAAFGLPAEIISAGWAPVRFKASEVSGEDVAKGKQWLGEGKESGRSR